MPFLHGKHICTRRVANITTTTARQMRQLGKSPKDMCDPMLHRLLCDCCQVIASEHGRIAINKTRNHLTKYILHIYIFRLFNSFIHKEMIII